MRTKLKITEGIFPMPVLMVTPPCDHIDRTVHPAYNYIHANCKFKYW